MELSSLKLDLYRRDFTINTLAVALNPKRFGLMMDFFSGQRDIKEKTLRALHNLSFVEDPTRAMRAVRFSERFGFKIGAHTLGLIKNLSKIDVSKNIPGTRLRDELINILTEEVRATTIGRLAELGLLKLIHGRIAWGKKQALLFEKTKETATWHKLLYTSDEVSEWICLFLALTDELTETELKELTVRHSMVGKKMLNIIPKKSILLV